MNDNEEVPQNLSLSDCLTLFEKFKNDVKGKPISKYLPNSKIDEIKISRFVDENDIPTGDYDVVIFAWVNGERYGNRLITYLEENNIMIEL